MPYLVPEPLVVVPAFNEEESVGSVVEDAHVALGYDVVVVDDGSIDATAENALAAGATVLRLPYNLGVGGAIRAALKFAQEQGYERVVQLDGDGQHEASEAKRLLEELDKGDVDLVVGTRFGAGYRVPRGRRVAMRVLSAIVSRRLGTSITDTTSGFRAMGPRAVSLFARRYPVDYLSDTVEALLLAGDAGLRVREVDVRMRRRQTGVPSSSPLRSTYHLARLLLGVAVRDVLRRPMEGGKT